MLPQQSVFVSEPSEDFNDFIFLASGQAIDLASEGLSAEQAKWLKDRLFEPDRSQGAILTDNLNPLEHLQTAKAERYRHFIIDLLGPEFLAR